MVLNGNARSVSDRLIRDVKQVLRHETLFVSRSLEEWEFIARRIARDRFDVVLCGGGDGTFARCADDILALSPARAPAFGVLRLGTGNALATTLASSSPSRRGLRRDLDRARCPEARRRLPMLRVNGRLAPFTGVGLDSLILEDYNAVKRALAPTPLARLGQGTPGYFLACATRSLWRFAFEPWPEVIIRNQGASTRRIDLDGRALGPFIPRGGIIYHGPAGIAACSTIPYYGLGLKLFPMALRRAGRFQLRVAQVDGADIVRRLPALFRGELRHDQIYDFHCDAVSIHLPEPTAVQIGGDEAGRHVRMDVRLTDIEAVWSEGAEPAEQAPVVQFNHHRRASR